MAQNKEQKYFIEDHTERARYLLNPWSKVVLAKVFCHKQDLDAQVNYYYRNSLSSNPTVYTPILSAVLDRTRDLIESIIQLPLLELLDENGNLLGFVEPFRHPYIPESLSFWEVDNLDAMQRIKNFGNKREE